MSAPVALTLQLSEQSTDVLCSTFQQSFLALQGKPITSIQSDESALSTTISLAKLDAVQVLLAPLLNLERLIHGHQTAVESPKIEELDESAYFFRGLNLLNAFVQHGAELSGISDVKLNPDVAGVQALTFHIRSLTTSFFAFKVTTPVVSLTLHLKKVTISCISSVCGASACRRTLCLAL
jgi:hypothetical protein